MNQFNGTESLVPAVQRAGIPFEEASSLAQVRDTIQDKIDSLQRRLKSSPYRKRASLLKKIDHYEDLHLQMITPFVERNMPLLYHVTSQYHFTHPLLDYVSLIEESQKALQRCACCWEPDGGATFGTYAARGMTYACDRVRIYSSRTRRNVAQTVSLEASFVSGEDGCIESTHPDSSQLLPSEIYGYKECCQYLMDALNHLFPREKEILIHRFGLNGYDEEILEDVGKRYKISRERIRQIENCALKKLQKYLRREDRAYCSSDV